MSKHRSISAEIAQIKKSISAMSAEQIRLNYGITIDPDTGEVYDLNTETEYPSIDQWVVKTQEDEDDYGYEQDHGGYFDDEEY